MKSKFGTTGQSNRLVKDSKLWVLVGLLLLTALVIAWQWSSGPAALSTANSKSGRAGTGGAKEDEADPTVLMGQLLEEKWDVEKGEKRNPFSFGQPPPPLPNPSSVQSELVAPPPPVCGDGNCQGGENHQNCPADCPPPPPSPAPPISLRYIGYLQESEGKVVFLTDGKEVYMGRINDIIANKYKVLKITDENVELGYLNLNQSKTIPFQGSKS